MAIRKSDGREAVWLGKDYASESLPRGKYPVIKTGDAGIVMQQHRFEVESNPEKPLAFYPKKWGLIYYFQVSEGQIKSITTKK